MNQEELKKAIGIFYPALVLDALLSRESREQVNTALQTALLILAALTAGAFGTKGLAVGSTSLASWLHRLQDWGPAILGAFLMILALWLVSRAFKAFYDSYYFTGLTTVLHEAGLSETKPAVSFAAARVLYLSLFSVDLTKAFVYSPQGLRTLVRVGVGRREALDFIVTAENTPRLCLGDESAKTESVGGADSSTTKFAPLPRLIPRRVPEGTACRGDRTRPNFISGRQSVTDLKTFTVNPRDAGEPIGLAEVAAAIAAADPAFAKFLSLHNVPVRDFAGSAEWVERLETYVRCRSRFWGKDILGRIKGLGKDWSVGAPYALLRFAHDITDRGAFDQSEESREHAEEIKTLEAVLARSGEANALLVADEGEGALDIVFSLGAMISQGSVLPPLEHKRIFLFDGNAFVATAKDKAAFESELIRLLNESLRAGNIILVLGDLPNFIESAKGVGADLLALLDPYLSSSDFQVIALANPGAFHRTLEGDGKIAHRFEKILVKGRDERASMRILENRALIEESKNKIFFTYQSIAAVSESAKRYMADGVLSDKAIHLLSEAVPAVLAKKKHVVDREDILELIEAKTGIPTGIVTQVEREKLLNLETILHARIIGQDEAIKAISGAMRRSRSDVANPERPMGSFLFLGPTGVGKTETTKALAATFFGKEDAVIRLDMSEYRTDDALKRLIGSFEDGKPGVLSSRLREQSYGVLLLDEFEKTNKEVLDLFLQILDEGFFSDMTGKRVNARNLIIVATSNAGSDMIWKLMREGKDVVVSKDEIVAEIISRGVFKPELLNRFDGVILFHPLSVDDLQKIAGLMLKKLVKRLAEKGIELVVNDALMKAVMSAGTDPEFGARPMNRAIQEKVEQVIAKKIITGEAKSGSRIELTEAELA